MSAAPAYRYDYSAQSADRFAYDYAYEPQRSPRSDRRPSIDVDVMRGGRTRAQSQPLSSSLVFLAKAVAVMLCVVAALCFARIALTSATVSTAIQTSEVSSQINSARSDGSKLEVAQSSLSNPTRIKDEAAALGMIAPYETATIDLSNDPVVIDADGNLSLFESVAVVARS